MKFLIAVLLVVGIVMVTFVVINNLYQTDTEAAGKSGSNGKESVSNSNREKVSSGSKQGSSGGKSGSNGKESTSRY